MFVDAKNPRWADREHTKVILDVQFIGEDRYVPFVASIDDVTTHGPMLYNFAANGVFGEIADSAEERIIAGELPLPEGHIVKDGELINIAMYEQQATAELNKRLALLINEEAKARAELDEEYADERKANLAALLAVKEQEGWPVTVVWPGE